MKDKLQDKLLNYLRKAISDYKMIETGDRVMVCLSGGKDSFTLLHLLNILSVRSNHKFTVFAFTLDQSQPGWNDSQLRSWLEQRNINYEILKRDTYSIVKEKIPEGKTYCSLCSRLRRGNIYQYAKTHKFNKIALGHHRDDLIRTLLMSIFYNGQIRSMPAKLKTDDGQNIVVRPLAYCQEKDIARFAEQQQFPIIPCNLCGTQENLMRQRVTRLIDELSTENPKVPSNILHALQTIRPSQMMDHTLFDFIGLKADTIDPTEEKESDEIT